MGMPDHRNIRAATICLGSGAFLSLAIAFMCARWSPRERTAVSLATFGRSPPVEGVTWKPLPTNCKLYGMVEFGFGYEYVAVLAINRRSQTTLMYGNGLRCESGYPLRAWVIVLDAPTVPNERPNYRGWFWTSRSVFARPNGTVTVFRPLWAGLAVDSVAYAAGVWLLVFGPGTLMAIIRGRRRRRGQCERCRYPVAGLARCPECGTATGLDVPPPPSGDMPACTSE